MNLAKLIGRISLKLNNMLTIGVVEEVDYAKAKARVRIAEITTAWLSWTTPCASSDVVWSAPEEGEQVLIASVGGNLSQGQIIGSLYSKAHPANGNKGIVRRITFEDGTVVEYDREQHRMLVDLPEGDIEINTGGNIKVNTDGSLSVKAAQEVTIECPKNTVKGDLHIDGEVTSTGDMKAGEISLQKHLHKSVKSGTDKSGLPT